MFAGFARASHYLGEFGNGSKMKFVANLLVAIHNVASAEAMVLGMKAGLDPDDIVRVISLGRGQHPRLRVARAADGEGRLQAGDDEERRLAQGLKIIGAFAKALKVDTPLFGRIAALNQEVLKQGYGDSDTAAICAVLEKRAKLKRKGG